MNPAYVVIQKCGGFSVVAEMMGRDETSVRRWAYSKENNGSGGFIPMELAQELLLKAREKGVKIEPADFFLRVK